MKITFITLTNKGYLPYTLNCLKSLDNIGITELKCYAIGKEAYQRIRRVNEHAEYIQDEANTDFQVFRRGDWASVTFYKFEIIYENLKTSDLVCFTDGDIVFKNPDVIDYCRSTIKQKDLLIQNDTMDDASRENLCTGFMFIKSNSTTLRCFNPQYVKEHSTIVEGWDDQVYINQIKDQLNFRMLPLELFPNGKYFTENHDKITPYLIHFNWQIGHKKLVQFVKFKEYYASSLLVLYFKKILFRDFKKSLKNTVRQIAPSASAGGKR